MSSLQYQGFPKPEAPAIASDGTFTFVWYRFLSNLWQQLGRSNIPIGQMVLLQQITQGLQALTASTGAVLGKLLTSFSVGGVPEPLALVNSPWTFSAPGPGTLLVSSGACAIGRGGTFYPAGLTGGVLPLMLGDSVQVTWYGHVPPTATWLPST